MNLPRPDLNPYLDHLRQLPFVRGLEVARFETAVARDARFDAVLRLRTPRRQHEFLVAAKRTHLTRALVNGVIAQLAQFTDRPWILFAPYIGRPMGHYLATHDVNYLDRAGNCRLQIGEEHFALIEGRRLEADGHRGRGLGKAGYQVLFAILARPELLDEPLRTLGNAAGTSKNTAAKTVARLTEEGLVGRGPNRRQILARQTILDRWLTGYANTVRPKLLVGVFRTPDIEPEVLENRVPAAFADEEQWAWGGGAAAVRLTGFYRGPETVLHVATWSKKHAGRLRAIRAVDGPLIVLGIPGEIALQGALPETAHPLLVYTELLTMGNERATEAAEEIRRQYLQR